MIVIRKATIAIETSVEGKLVVWQLNESHERCGPVRCFNRVDEILDLLASRFPDHAPCWGRPSGLVETQSEHLVTTWSAVEDLIDQRREEWSGLKAGKLALLAQTALRDGICTQDDSIKRARLIEAAAMIIAAAERLTPIDRGPRQPSDG